MKILAIYQYLMKYFFLYEFFLNIIQNWEIEKL